MISLIACDVCSRDAWKCTCVLAMKKSFKEIHYCRFDGNVKSFEISTLHTHMHTEIDRLLHWLILALSIQKRTYVNYNHFTNFQLKSWRKEILLNIFTDWAYMERSRIYQYILTYKKTQCRYISELFCLKHLPLNAFLSVLWYIDTQRQREIQRHKNTKTHGISCRNILVLFHFNCIRIWILLFSISIWLYS